uniref:NADH-ubiquinone oxidoreductase chain 4L n=1 Tax=Staphylinidae sp. BMNH 1274170 TaxID=1796551 RepID=A0A140EGL4_9COLE|nr:NADH dehydrogenase subunit 4L [Staphylinidae sp. BMNH 1274170]
MVMIFSCFMFLCGVMVFSMKRKHLLLMLMSLEFIILSLYFSMYIYLLNFNCEFFLLMLFLTISVCESALGLSILVSLIRTHGNDYFQTFSILW